MTTHSPGGPAPAEKRAPKWTWDELILAADLVVEANWRQVDGSDPRVVALSELLRKGSPVPEESRGPRFRNPNGVSRKTADIASHHPDYPGKPTNGGKLDLKVIEAFIADPKGMHRQAMQIRAAMAEGVSDFDLVDQALDDFALDEGRVVLIQHRRRERNPKVRQAKIEHAKSIGQPLVCEVCERNLAHEFGDLVAPEALLDVHHIVPLASSGSRTSRPQDLALVCPTCHRALHRIVGVENPAALKAALRGT